jgi:two-component system, cell cycle sensor histidine kinase and response regulator CckA
MERFEAQRWLSHEVARLIAMFEGERRFYDEMLTVLPVPLATVDNEGALLSANRAFLREFGIRREDVERTTLGTLFRDADWGEALRPHVPAELAVGRFRVTVTPVPRWDRGETEWMVVFQEAISASEPAAPAAAAPVDEELIGNTAAVEASQRLAARVTHEANNLVMIAAGYGREILDQLPAESTMRDDVSMLLDATGRIEAMAAQLNEYSRVGRSETDSYALRDVLPVGGFRLATRVPDVAVQTDKGALAEVFAALAAMAPGALEIEATADGQEAIVTVKGFGMSAENVRQQLEVLNKAAREGKAGARECALIGPRLVQAGVRWKIGGDAAFEMHIPLGTARKHGGGSSALVVDDQAGIRAIVRRILESRGFQVTEAGTGEEAAALLERRPEAFQLLVTDMRMPGMTGRDLAERVRYRHPTTRILFISGFTDDPGVQTGIFPEGSAFLAKPFHPAQLIEAITKLLG